MLTRPAEAARRGRPRNVARLREIVRRAVVAFADHGYDGCTMANVAARCGIGATQLRRYFPTKDALLAAAADDAHERLTAADEALRTAAARNPSLRDFLLVAGNIYVHHADQLSAWYAALLGGLPLDARQRERLREAEEALYRTLGRCAGARGSAGDPYVFARAFAGALQWLVLQQNRAAFEPPASELRQIFLEELVRLLCSAPERTAR